MTLFSAPADAQSHRTRIVLAEKDITVDIIDVDPDNLPEDLSDLNPYNSVPTLVDRELTLYDPRVIMEYLDERFPHPPLMPVDPVSRARSRMALCRIETDWYTLLDELESGVDKRVSKAAKLLRESIIAADPLFEVAPFFLSEEFTLVDCTVAPILWRLPRWGVELPKSAKAVQSYMARMFERPSFQQSLTEAELEMRG
jgi:RNA polymerase-associated protein